MFKLRSSKILALLTSRPRVGWFWRRTVDWSPWLARQQWNVSDFGPIFRKEQEETASNRLARTWIQFALRSRWHIV